MPSAMRSAKPRTPKLILILGGLWLISVCLLAGWWGYLLRAQAQKIVELENRLGLASESALGNFRMVFWESSAFFVLLLVFTGILLWLYFRDLKRSKILQGFFASVTHELKTPLASIRLQAEAMASDPSEKLIARLLQDTERLEDQVDRILELARVEGGGSVHQEPIQLKNWIESFLSRNRKDRIHEIQIDRKIGDETIIGDPAALQVIFRNLLENTWRHSGKHGAKLQLETHSEDKNLVLLSVRDDGKGPSIPVRKLGTLFSKGSTSNGAGVGLYLIRLLMNRMGGVVEYRKSDGFEARLWFRRGKEQLHASSI